MGPGIKIRPGVCAAMLVVAVCWAAPSALAQKARQQPATKKEQPARPSTNIAGKPQVQPDRVEQIIKGLDPKLLNLSGAELDVEIVGDQLILRGNEDDLQVVELLVAILESTTQKKELRVVTVTEKDAKDIAKMQTELREIFKQPNQRPEDEVTVTALSANILLVAALPKDIEFVVNLIKKVDETVEDIPLKEQLVFPIKYRKAADVAEQLTDIIKKMQEKKGVSGAKAEIQVIANDANNSIMVLAPETERAKIQKLLNELDVEPVKGWGEIKLTFYPLLHSKANELSDTITELLTSQVDRESAEETIYRMQISKALPSGDIIDLPLIDLQKPTRILPDEGTNSLIVATVEENIGPIGELVRLLDGVPIAEGLDVRFFPLRFADAESISGVLTEMFDSGKQLPEDPDGSGTGAVPEGDFGKAIVYNVGLSTDVRTNTLIASGRPEQLDLVTRIVGQLDRPATALKFPLKMIELDHTDASQVGKLIQELLDQRFQALEGSGAGKAAIERERVFLTVDIRSNSLVVSASEENYAEIVAIARQLDTKPVRLFDQIRIINLLRLDAQDMKTKIEDLWQRKAELRREEEMLEDLPVIVVDSRSNAMIIASSVEDYDEIKRLVDTLEAQPLTDNMRLFKLEYADVMVLAGMLEEIFTGIAGQSETFQEPTVLPDPRSNTLVIAGNQDAMERAVELVRRLDVKGGSMTAQFKVYPLQHASSGQLATRIQELFDARSEGDEMPHTPIVILPDESSNSLVCSASREDHQTLVELLSKLDRPSTIARQFHIFPLKMAKAANVVEKLESLFESSADGASGRTDAIATDVDERTNSIIVWASPSQMVNIAEIVEKIDTTTPVVEMMMKVIQLKQALAQDFAELLENTLVGEGGDDEAALIVSFLQKRPDGSETLRRLLRQDIKIKPDQRTNSLMVMAPTDSMAMLEAMIHEFDTVRPIISEIRLFPLVNSDAENMVDQLTDIFDQEGAEGETPSRLIFGDSGGEVDVASVGQELRFAADSRTNTLIAAGAAVDLRMVEELIRYLDAQAAEDRLTQVYPANYSDAADLARAIQDFNQQEQDVLGEGDDKESRSRRMERQISVVSMGGEEEGSSTLIVGSSRQHHQKTMDMIRELDRPEPQVMISVLIAEVTLSDEFEFGVEFAGQDLHFSEEAIAGPNGVIQGTNFDFVGGTSLNAAGSGLGFSFAVNGEDFSFLLHALQTNSRLDVLSRPILVVRNGEEGNITIADSVPFVSVAGLSDTGQTQSQVAYEDVGIVLTATPHISPDGYVTIALSQEISSFAGENIQLTEGVTSPVFQQREVATNVTVRDGETVVIGGLITSRESEGENKVPFLGDLPYVGAAFRSKSISKSKTELIIVMSVDVIRTDDDRHKMSIKQRDMYSESRTLHQSPLMEGLRIVPDETLMGPRDGRSEEPIGIDPKRSPKAPEPQQYGPKPKTYGPVIPSPQRLQRTQNPVYGPTLVRNDPTPARG